MIAYLSTAAHAYTIQWLIQPDGWVPELQDTIVPYSYEQLLQPHPQPLFETYIFTDLERLDLPHPSVHKLLGRLDARIEPLHMTDLQVAAGARDRLFQHQHIGNTHA